MNYGRGPTAPLRNVGLMMELADRVMNRSDNMPGIATFHGFSGYGKSCSACLAANTYRAAYIEVKAAWCLGTFLNLLLLELGEKEPRGSAGDRTNKIIQLLSEDPRLLIIDEFDYVVAKRYVDTVRDIAENSGSGVIIIGEELLPAKLVKYERFHNRVIDWVAAQPTDMQDARHLAKLYAPEVEIAENLLAKITEASAGRARRVRVNIERARELALTSNLATVDLAAWGDRPFFMSRPPQGRL